MGKQKSEKDWNLTQWRDFLMLRAYKEQTAAVDSARKYHLHVCPLCLGGDDKVEYLRCMNQRHVPISEYQRAEGIRPSIEEASLQVYQYCTRHARGHAALVKASSPIEESVRILLALYEEWDLSPVDALVETFMEDRIRWRKVVSEMNQRGALREYAARRAAGERGFTRPVAKKWGVKPNTLKVLAMRQRKKPSP